MVCMQKNGNETNCVPDDEMPRDMYVFHVVPFFHSICLFVSIRLLFIHSFNEFPAKRSGERMEKIVSRKNGDNHVNFINHLPKKKRAKQERGDVPLLPFCWRLSTQSFLGFGNRIVTSERLVVILSQHCCLLYRFSFCSFFFFPIHFCSMPLLLVVCLCAFVRLGRNVES